MTDETQQQLTQRQLWHKKYYQANRERLNEYQMQYHNENREERLKYQREYNKKYYQANRGRNRKAEKIEKMMSVTESINVSASSSEACVPAALETEAPQTSMVLHQEESPIVTEQLLPPSQPLEPSVPSVPSGAWKKKRRH